MCLHFTLHVFRHNTGSLDDVYAQASAARAAGYTIIAIGIGNGADTGTLNTITGDASKVLTVTQASELNSKADTVIQMLADITTYSK